MEEVWKDIPDYEGYYQISSHGNVRSVDRIVSNPVHGTCLLKGKPKALTSSKGWPIVNLCKNGVAKWFYVHNLVAECFVGSKPDNEQVRHKDGNPLNNRFDNLCFGTAKDNAGDREKHGTTAKGEKIANSKLTETNVLDIRNLLSSGMKIATLARQFDVDWSTIARIRDRKTWKHI